MLPSFLLCLLFSNLGCCFTRFATNRRPQHSGLPGLHDPTTGSGARPAELLSHVLNRALRSTCNRRPVGLRHQPQEFLSHWLTADRPRHWLTPPRRALRIFGQSKETIAFVGHADRRLCKGQFERLGDSYMTQTRRCQTFSANTTSWLQMEFAHFWPLTSNRLHLHLHKQGLGWIINESGEQTRDCRRRPGPDWHRPRQWRYFNQRLTSGHTTMI